MICAIKEKIYNFDPYNVLLAIGTNIPVLDWFCAPESPICFTIVIITWYLPGLAPCPFEGPALEPYPNAEPT